MKKQKQNTMGESKKSKRHGTRSRKKMQNTMKISKKVKEPSRMFRQNEIEYDEGE